MPTLFKQDDFIGGLDVELDATKTPSSSYPLLVNGRSRRDVIDPTFKHLEIHDFEGAEVQGVYTAGSLLVVFVAGVAYYANLAFSPVNLTAVSGWRVMNTTGRIRAVLTVATTNFFNREASTQAVAIGLTASDLTSRVFNASLVGVPQALFVFDGTNRPQALFSDSLGNLTPRDLGDYGTWTPDNPEYVPIGTMACVQGNKLFLLANDLHRIVASVSGRMNDFMIIIDANGDKIVPASFLATAVSFQEVTSIRPIDSGQVLVQTLYASYTIDLNYDDPLFGEPNLIPGPLFAVGTINDISFAPAADNDTAFITQSGIQSFNAVKQAKTESNNTPFGAKIRGLLRNPQTNTCAGIHDDYSLFQVNTIFGRGVVVYDTTRKNFQSLDLSFGDVLQFSNTRVAGAERLFFGTRDNKIYEAFADTSAINTTKVYLGEWTADAANSDILVDMIDLIFTDVKTAGQCKISVFADRVLNQEAVFEVDADGYVDNYPIQIPFTPALQVKTVGLSLTNKPRAWKIGVMVEWNFQGSLSNVSVDGGQRTSDNNELEPQTKVQPETFAFVADTGFGAELNDSVDYETGGFKTVAVTAGERYVFNPGNAGTLANGTQHITTLATFRALGSHVAISGTAATVPTYSLKNAENMMLVLDAVYERSPAAIIGGGDHSYPNGTATEVAMGLLPLQARLPFHPVAGDIEYNTSLATAFFNAAQFPRYYTKLFNFVEFFFYNGGWTESNAVVNSSGVAFGATSEHDGNSTTSIQAGWLRNKIAESDAVFKIVVCHFPGYTDDNTYSPGYAALRFLATVGAHAVISGHGHVMERRIVDGFPWFVAGVGGKSLNTFKAGQDNDAFRDNENYGYLEIESDPLSCRLTFRDLENNVLDSYTLTP